MKSNAPTRTPSYWRQMDWIIYMLKCPRTQQVRYVGFTTTTARARLLKHVNDAIGGPQKTYRQRWIFSLVSIGLMPIIETIETGSGPGWGDAERRWIAHYRSQGARLVNATDGGEGLFGWGTPEQRSAIAKNATAKLTAEQRAARSEKIRAAMTPEHRNGLARYQEAMTAQQRSERAKSAVAGLTTEDRSARARKGWADATPEERRAAGERLANARCDLTPEQRRAAARKAYAAKTPEQHRQLIAAAEEARAKFTPEQRSAIIKKRWIGLTAEQRTAQVKRMQRAYTTERRSAAAKQGRAKKRAAHLEGAAPTPPIAT